MGYTGSSHDPESTHPPSHCQQVEVAELAGVLLMPASSVLILPIQYHMKAFYKNGATDSGFFSAISHIMIS